MNQSIRDEKGGIDMCTKRRSLFAGFESYDDDGDVVCRVVG